MPSRTLFVTTALPYANAPFHIGHIMEYIKGECPNCGAKDQYGDACENFSSVYAATELKNPYSALSGAKPVIKSSEHYFFRLSDLKCKAFIRQWLETPGRLQPQVVNKAKE